MGRTKNNAEKAKMLGYDKTLQQLKSWKVNFHELLWENLVLIY